MRTRRIEPEWLDEMPPDDPAAVSSRKDLQRINRAMGNTRILLRALTAACRQRDFSTLIEIGAGDGTLALRLLPELSGKSSLREVVLVDRVRLVSEATRERYRALGCSLTTHESDVFHWLESTTIPEDSCVMSNLFLHHFPDSSLSRLFRLVAPRCRHFVACEPRRSWLALGFSHLVGAIGCNKVTRHDAVVSVAAGFAHQELSRLWPVPDEWVLSETVEPPFSHSFRASLRYG